MTRKTVFISTLLLAGVLVGAEPWLVVDTNAFATADVAAELQKVIDANPHRTIYLPDGTYELKRPILTSADPDYTVSLKLGEFAILRAASDWSSPEAIVRLGALRPKNDIDTVGSNYSFTGGIIDGAGVANGLSIESGRETHVRDVSMKRVRIGIHIKFGANCGSSDADIERVNITGTGKADSVGVLAEGHDNTFSKMRIGHVQTGMLLKSGGNSLRDVHPLFYFDNRTPEEVRASVGFDDRAGGNTYDYCYSDQFAIGFRMGKNVRNIYSNCLVFWYSPKSGREVGFCAEGRLDSRIRDARVTFRGDSPKAVNRVLEVAEAGGCGAINGIVFPDGTTDDKTHEAYAGK